ncbi:MAG: formate-dependent phosphoribosylglycinamide formyltransferase [Leptolyngbyaceae cyanobacterium]
MTETTSESTPTVWGTPLLADAKTLLLLGSGELGREVAIEAMRLGIEVVAVDRYAHAPAMQVAPRSHVIDMLAGDRLRDIVEQTQPDLIVPEVEAIATETLVALEQEGWTVIPTAKATQLTMNREGIRRLAAEELHLRTSPYRFAGSLEDYRAAVAAIGLPCVVKPIMSSSGKGQSLVRSPQEIDAAWDYAYRAGRGKTKHVIVEGFIQFDTEITLLTVQAHDGTHFCPPIGHRQVAGDYRESWQPCALHPATLKDCQQMADTITAALGGRGLFGVELFIAGPPDQPQTVYFSEVSPRPHDTGMVTMVSQNMSEFELHIRAIMGLPIGKIQLWQPGASAVILAPGTSDQPRYSGIAEALTVPTSKVRLFGKPRCHPQRRMGVALALGDSVEQAQERAIACASKVQVLL